MVLSEILWRPIIPHKVIHLRICLVGVLDITPFASRWSLSSRHFAISVIANVCVVGQSYAETLNYPYRTTKLETQVSRIDSVYRNPVVIPFSATDSLSASGVAAESNYEFTNSGFTISFQHSRGSGSHADLAASSGTIYFRVDEATEYEVSGGYTAIDPEGRGLGLALIITPVISDPFPSWPILEEQYNTFQSGVCRLSSGTPNQSFTLLGPDENSNMLIAGVPYEVSSPAS